jgi:glycosyltransferase involved in cell wall biosynthesis
VTSRSFSGDGENGLAVDRQPLVSIVTPGLNAGRFLEETIQSVLTQDYPHLEYVVMDGGSTDGSLEILERYSARLRYFSVPDRGQADAVNRGFELSKGSIFAFLNADDTYLPGAVSAAVQCLAEHPEAGVAYGEGYHVSESGKTINRYPTQPFDAKQLCRLCYICQPTAFVRRGAFRQSGMLNPNLQFAFDYDLWIRMARRVAMVKIDRYLACSRMHRDNKTLGQLQRMFQEVFTVFRRHYDYIPCNWLYGYSDYLITGKEPVFEAPPLTPANLALCFLLGAGYNWRHPLRYGVDLLENARRIGRCVSQS